VIKSMPTREETEMADTGPATTAPPSVRDRPGLRITLLSAAAAILLLGATAAGAYGYVAVIGR
jgi:hypothetical protein